MKDGAVVGGIAGALFSVMRQTAAKQINPERSFDWGEVITYGVVGAGVGSAAAILPDFLEPAIHPHHRRFFHSMTCGLLALYGGTKGYNAATSDIAKVASLSAGGGYAAHLLADSLTPFSISLV